MTETKQTSPFSPEARETLIVGGQSKVAAVLALLESGQGATLADLVAATGWLPHTTRAVLSGLKKKGRAVDREKVDGISRYRITKAAGQ